MTNFTDMTDAEILAERDRQFYASQNARSYAARLKADDESWACQSELNRREAEFTNWPR